MTAEERYDLECQINALYDEAEYAEDHNNYWKANSLRQEADELQKKLDAGADDTNEGFSEDCDPFDVDWTDEKYAERRKQSKGIKEAIEPDGECVEFLKPGFKVPEHQVLIDLFSEIKPLYCKATDEYVYTYFGDENDNTHGCEVSFKVEDGNKLKLTVRGNFIGDPSVEKIFDLDHISPLGILRFIDENRLNVCHANVDKVKEDYTGSPEERTDHLDYVDDNPTDDKFKFPKNITKKEDDHCKKSNPVVNHDPDDESILKEDWRDDVGLAPMWCCKNFKDLYEYMKKHGEADAKDKTFAKLAREAVKQLKQKYSVSNQEAAEIIARGQALYKLLFESESTKLDKPLKEAHQPSVISGFVVDFCDGDFNWYEDFGESYAYVDVYPQKSGIGADTTVTFIFSGPHGDWYDYDFSAHDYGYQFGQRAVELEISYFTPDYKNDELTRKVAKYSDYPENNIISDSDAMTILGVDQMTYDQLIIKAAQEAAEWFNSRAEEYVDDHASDLFDWDRW